jgi:hypothetical protein
MSQNCHLTVIQFALRSNTARLGLMACAIPDATASEPLDLGPTASRPSLKLPAALLASSFLIDGEAVIVRDDGTAGLPCAAGQTSGQ